MEWFIEGRLVALCKNIIYIVFVGGMFCSDVIFCGGLLLYIEVYG